MNMAGLDQAAVRAACREREYLKGEQLGFVTPDRLQAAGLRKLNTLTHTQTQGLGHFSHSSCQWADKYFPHVCFAVVEPNQRRGEKKRATEFGLLLSKYDMVYRLASSSSSTALSSP